jgi:hypothetical protein
MADVSVKVLTPATDFAFMTLDELKTALGITATTPATDEQWTWLLEVNSTTIATLCNRVFAREEVEETWRDLMNQRVYLSHFPVLETDIASVTTNGTDRLDWELEEASGKLSIFTDREEPIIVTYTGGYNLPDEAPMPLKQALALMAANFKAQLAMVQVTGVRMIAHKESRVMFHTPVAGAAAVSRPAFAGVPPAVESILYHFTRFWV